MNFDSFLARINLSTFYYLHIIRIDDFFFTADCHDMLFVIFLLFTFVCKNNINLIFICLGRFFMQADERERQ